MSKSDQVVKPYVRALLSIKDAALTRQEIQAIDETWSHCDTLRTYCAMSDKLPSGEQRTAMQAIWQGTLSPALMIIIDALAQNQILNLIPVLCQAFIVADRQRQGIKLVKATFAIPPSPTQQDAFNLQVKTRYGEQSIIEVHTDDSLIAGLLIQIDHTRIDASLAGRLKRLRLAHIY